MFKKLVSKIVGDPNKKIINDLEPLVTEVADLEPGLQQLSDEELRAKTAVLRERLENGAALDELLPEAYALVREASIRTTGMRQYDVQIMGGVLLHRGEVVEMRTGEGKTLVATLPLFLNALTGEGVHLVTVNEYLAKRDGGWMGKIFSHLGLTVGCIGPQQFSALYDAEYVHPGSELEDERLVHWRPCTRTQAYQADITYGISSEFGFDYLRDNMVNNPDNLVQRKLQFAVIDEVDNVLIDEARTPLIISGPAPRSGKDYARFSAYVRNLRRNTADEDDEPNGHYDLDEKSRSVSLTDMGIAEIESRIPEIDADAGDSLYDPRFYQLTYYLDNAMRAQYLFKRDVNYVVQEGQVIIVDDFTGRLMPGRRYSDGLHEAIEAKENVDIKRETVTVATITLQNYFRLYEKLAGMTGTALTDAEEFDEIYELGVTPLPTNVQHIVDKGEMGLVPKKTKVEGTDAISYVDPQSDAPIFFKRTDFKDQIYGTEQAKDQAIINEIQRVQESGRPTLVGTTSVEHSEIIHHHLERAKIPHSVLNAKIHQSEALIVAQAGRKGAVTISTNMAGRGTDILLGGNAEGMAAETLEAELFDRHLLTNLAVTLLTDGEAPARDYAVRQRKLNPELVDGLIRIKAEFDAAMVEIEQIQVVGFLAHTLQEPYDIDYNQVLNILRYIRVGQLGQARAYVEGLDRDTAVVEEAVRLEELHTRYKNVHKDENLAAQFIAEQLFDQHYNARAALIRSVLGGERQEAEHIVAQIPGLDSELITQIEAIQHQTELEREEVWRLGGLHVIGSERHESRRIDNQLRGRAARQGDPGSSRFFLSLEDDLMRRFGGERLKSFMSRTNIPDDMPIENGMLDRIIESSQERIEGYNFDIRKNVVEYDDVMTKQRQAIYGERRKILQSDPETLDNKIDDAFDVMIAELVDNYVENYTDFAHSEIERVINDFSTDATDDINLTGVLRTLRSLLPGITEIDQAEFEGLPAEKLTDRLMQLVRQNDEEGTNLYQLLDAMGRFLPLLPPVPNLATLATRRSGQLQARELAQRQFLENVALLYNELLANHIEESERARIWQDTENAISEAFNQFSLDALSIKNATARQQRFRVTVIEALKEMLLESLDALDGPHLVQALGDYVDIHQQKWQDHIGVEEYRNFQRLLLLAAIDREWRDYLTAMDDLRREIGLEAIGQRDPKMMYKQRSFQMFSHMRKNIDRDIADRFFRQIVSHEQFVRQQQAEVQYQLQSQDAGYQKVQRKSGRGVEVRRDAPKVGRNDPCPCGSGKKYKQCHGRLQKRPKSKTATTNQAVSNNQGATKKKKVRRRRR
ncbi:MAG: SEC-C domain-containing protein [Anaerolineales bacterium]|nr:SEC-C domain-containing protein [Anaerolineales bacterium]